MAPVPAQLSADKFIVAIKDVAALRAAYLPFLINGGLLLPVETFPAIGTRVFLLLYLLDEHIPYAVSGRIAWTAPERSSLPWGRGVGIQFGAGNLKLQHRLGSYLNPGERADQQSA